MNVGQLLKRYWKGGVPDSFPITTITGEAQTVVGMRGRVIGVDFWDGAWCLTHIPTSTTILGNYGVAELDGALYLAGKLDRIMPEHGPDQATVDCLNEFYADYDINRRVRL